ncbi:MAG: lysophospholipid acyltransferase family protein [Gemmatimonadaceae bacterium]
MISVARTLFTILIITLLTIVGAAIVVAAAVIGVPNRPGSLYDVIPRVWARSALWAAGVKVRAHGLEKLAPGGAYIFICNHLSLFDILALVGLLPRHNFVAKAELFKIPVFGPGMRVLGTVPMERENQKAAFGAYDVAAERIRGGSSVVVFPEGTRGTEYSIRRFKKGPFVLAIKAAAAVVPVVIYGTLDVLPKGKLFLKPGIIDVYILDQVLTKGMTYDDRELLAHTVHERMASVMKEIHSNH